jgi:hypothetical protein
MSNLIRTALIAGFGAFLTVSCSTDAVSPASLGSIVPVSGDAQTGTPGQPLRDTLRAQVLSTTGRPMSGVSVQWKVTYGGAEIATQSDTSDAKGDVAATLTLGPAPGAAQVVVTAADLPGVTFTATGRGLQASTLAVGLATACAIDIESRAWCWGSPDASGDSGLATAPYYVPRLVAGGHRFTELAAGVEHVCGLEATGQTWCWGKDDFQQLGTGAVGNADRPIALAGAPAFVHIYGGDGYHTCGLVSDGTAYCWGRDDQGQVGSGASTLAVGTPTVVAGGLKFTSLSPTYDHTCGIAVGGAAYCWGNNASYLLGDGGASGPTSNVPVAVTGGHIFRSLSTTDAYTCGFTTDAGPLCWGQVPDGAAPRGTPSAAPQLASLSEYLAAGASSFGIRGNRGVTLQSFSTVSDEGAPVPLHALAAGYWTSCALAQDGTVYCWGNNDQGQAGNPQDYGYDSGWSEAHAVVVPPNY